MAAHPFNTKLVCHEGWIDLSFALKGYAEKFCINLAKRQSFVVLDPESLKVMAYANGKDGKFYLPNHEVFGQSKHHLGPSQISYQDFSIPPLADSKPEPRIQL